MISRRVPCIMVGLITNVLCIIYKNFQSTCIFTKYWRGRHFHSKCRGEEDCNSVTGLTCVGVGVLEVSPSLEVPRVRIRFVITGSHSQSSGHCPGQSQWKHTDSHRQYQLTDNAWEQRGSMHSNSFKTSNTIVSHSVLFKFQ